MEYRKDIQILRGIALLLVVFYHLGIALFESGFLGVDAFFVISGFLMCKLYIKGQASNFFVKRVFRLLPAYFITLLVTLLFAMVISKPNEHRMLIEQALYATGLSSNVGYWLYTSYFENLEFRPLLHFWSIGIEVQFYLIVPLLSWFFFQSKRFLWAFIVLSLLACFILTTANPKTSFFMLPFRLWEFLLGYAVAFYSHYWVVTRKRTYLGLAGLVGLIIIPILPVNGSGYSFVTGHPGLFAVFVCVSTATVLAFKLPKKLMDNPVFTSLEWLGTYSYSIYLAHFPVIALYLYRPFSGTILKTDSYFDLLSIVLLIMMFSFLLYYFIERKFRAHHSVSGKHAFVYFILLTVCLISLSQLKYLYPEKQRNLFAAWYDRDVYRCGRAAALNPFKPTCVIAQPVEKINKNVMLIGNSHADSLKRVFADAAYNAGLKVHFAVRNTPLMKQGMTVDTLLNIARNKDVADIYLHYSPTKISQVNIEQLVHGASLSNINVVLIMPVPTWKVHIPRSVYQQQIDGISRVPSLHKEDYYRENQELTTRIAAIKQDNFSVVHTIDSFCDKKCHFMTTQAKPYYYDGGHLTLTGSNLLSDVFSALFSSDKMSIISKPQASNLAKPESK